MPNNETSPDMTPNAEPQLGRDYETVSRGLANAIHLKEGLESSGYPVPEELEADIQANVDWLEYLQARPYQTVDKDAVTRTRIGQGTFYNADNARERRFESTTKAHEDKTYFEIKRDLKKAINSGDLTVQKDLEQAFYEELGKMIDSGILQPDEAVEEKKSILGTFDKPSEKQPQLAEIPKGVFEAPAEPVKPESDDTVIDITPERWKKEQELQSRRGELEIALTGHLMVSEKLAIAKELGEIEGQLESLGVDLGPQYDKQELRNELQQTIKVKDRVIDWFKRSQIYLRNPEIALMNTREYLRNNKGRLALGATVIALGIGVYAVYKNLDHGMSNDLANAGDIPTIDPGAGTEMTIPITGLDPGSVDHSSVSHAVAGNHGHVAGNAINNTAVPTEIGDHAYNSAEIAFIDHIDKGDGLTKTVKDMYPNLSEQQLGNVWNELSNNHSTQEIINMFPGSEATPQSVMTSGNWNPSWKVWYGATGEGGVSRYGADSLEEILKRLGYWQG